MLPDEPSPQLHPQFFLNLTTMSSPETPFWSSDWYSWGQTPSLTGHLSLFLGADSEFHFVWCSPCFPGACFYIAAPWAFTLLVSLEAWVPTIYLPTGSLINVCRNDCSHVCIFHRFAEHSWSGDHRLRSSNHADHKIKFSPSPSSFIAVSSACFPKPEPWDPLDASPLSQAP